MGEVYRALDTRLDRTVAIKILPAHLSSNPGARERFEREARTISSLNHPHICQLYDVGEQDGASFLVMEFLEGETLAERLGKGPIPLEPCLKIGVELCEGLEKAHRSGVIHRDLKPANIFLTPDGHAKLLDFGLAKTSTRLTERDPEETRANDEDNLTSPGSAVGTVMYMSPEQARGETLDERSDLFSLGIVIYEMASGQKPFAGSSHAVIFDSILNRQPVPLSQTNPDLPMAFGDMLTRLMEKSSRNRYQSAREVIDTLREIQRDGQSSSSTKVRAGRKIPSIAVLPFANLSADPDNQYFSDGLSEDLMSALARLQGLLVASRSSAFRFRGASADIREIGRQLNVEAVLEGSVRRSGTRLRITAQLVNVADGFHLWSERYDREVTDIFEIQDEITAAIIKTLEPTLAGEQQALTRRHSDNLQAYEMYLKGRRLWDQRTDSSLRAGLECFRAAIELDPDYALAYTGVADSFSILAVYGHTSTTEGRPRAEAAMKKALELDPTLAEAHFSMALSTTIFASRPGDAEPHFRKALDIQPRASAVHAYFSLFLATQHCFDEAQLHIAKAIELDPLSSFVHGLTALSLQCSGRYEAAAQLAHRALEIQPNLMLGLWAQEMAAGSLAQWDDAIETGERLAAVTRHSALFLGHLAKAYCMAGQKEKSLAILREVLQRQQIGEYISPMCLILIYTALNDAGNAQAALLAYIEDGGNGWGLEVAVGSYVDTLAVDKGCAELLRRIGRLP